MIDIPRTLILIFVAVVMPVLSGAQTVGVAHVVKSRSIINADDLVLLPTTTPGAIDNIDKIVGLETRKTLYPGQVILPSDVGPPAIVQRNEIITLVYDIGALSISTEGRALGRGAIGEQIRVMNIASRATLSGVISGPGKIRIQP